MRSPMTEPGVHPKPLGSLVGGSSFLHSHPAHLLTGESPLSPKRREHAMTPLLWQAGLCHAARPPALPLPQGEEERVTS